MGAVKSAIARKTGSTDTIYEVIYVEVIDPSDITSGVQSVAAKQTILNDRKITVDSVAISRLSNLNKKESDGS